MSRYPATIALVLSLCALTLPACAGGAAETRPDTPAVAESAPADHQLTWKQVKAARAEGAVLVDARGPAAYARGHIPGAINVPCRDEAAAEKLPAARDTHLVFYCAGAACSASTSAAEKAMARGFTQVSEFRGGYAAWTERVGLDAPNARPADEGVELLSWEQVEVAMAEGAVLVDARTAGGFAKGHIRGAINVPVRATAAYASLPEDRGVQVIFYCAGPACAASSAGARKAIELGFTRVAEYRGGYPEWRSRQPVSL